jgi:hypothetical protein
MRPRHDDTGTITREQLFAQHAGVAVGQQRKERCDRATLAIGRWLRQGEGPEAACSSFRRFIQCSSRQGAGVYVGTALPGLAAMKMNEITGPVLWTLKVFVTRRGSCWMNVSHEFERLCVRPIAPSRVQGPAKARKDKEEGYESSRK